jgi:hypothetical protein
MTLRTGQQTTLLDGILREIEPVLNEINAMPITAGEKKRLTRRWLADCIAQLAGTQGNGDATNSK